MSAIVRDQFTTARRFWQNPRTRTPILVVSVASFGGALHSAVTTYYYLEVGASELDIGRIGFIMSLGSLVLSPLAGHVLDQRGPFLPIGIAAATCSAGCLFRGTANSVRGLFLGAALLGVGVNLWTVVLAHLVNSFDRSLRSEVLSGFAVQTTCLQLIAKGLFPPFDWFLRQTMTASLGGDDDVLPRYRLHMGLCTFFCFFGTFALIIDRTNVSSNTGTLQQRSGIDNPVGEKDSTSDDSSSNKAPAVRPMKSIQLASAEENNTTVILNDDTTKNTHHTNNNNTTILVLIVSLLVQSIGTTVFSVLWPLVLRDRYDLSASEFGVLEFVSSLVSTSAVASFPVVERCLGRPNRTAALCAAIAAIAGAVAFCCRLNRHHNIGHHHHDAGHDDGDDYYNNHSYYADKEEVRFLQQYTTMSSSSSNSSAQRIISETIAATSNNNSGVSGGGIFVDVWRHAVMAILFRASLFVLEPSLKSILSLTVTSTSQGRALGFMTTLGSVGGMIGNVAGTHLFRVSKQTTTFNLLLVSSLFFRKDDDNNVADTTNHLDGGFLPFIVVTLSLGVASVLLLGCFSSSSTAARCDNKDPSSLLFVPNNNSATNDAADAELGQFVNNGDNNEVSRVTDVSLGCSSLLQRDTTYDLKLD